MVGPAYSYISPFAPACAQGFDAASTIALPAAGTAADGTPLATMPRFGLGSWEMVGSTAQNAVQAAIADAGYRLVDTARYYRNADEVGSAIRASKLKREEIFLIDKLFTNDLGGGVNTRYAVEDSLTRFNVEYIDLMLVHAPDGGKDFRLASWATLVDFVKEGKIRYLGVSNFGKHHIDELWESEEAKDVKPVVNQCEVHPWFQQRELRQHCEKKGIIMQAYCPLARNQYKADPTVARIAARKHLTKAQVLLRWSIQSGLIPIPKSASLERQRENLASLASSAHLDENDMAALDALDRGKHGWVETQVLSQDEP
ncbi:unnamed protein product [Tilletia controversa]|uniref:NADP-dependent oxidoreductase domain-containing protein n=2 Tax=Tilletia TaxID=13289 RepID=A0A177V8Z4_9BASI|nr:hypothetical protein CF336_g2126 [Tilletia laevis]KAE8202922.1 hypothetical protein CF328_g1937 [Tilletia controversa]KAE8263395.1 hypothetical protein A4X03_0g1711 [Tilletia caries]KAE8206990.1 hypothetical protein CF335_g1470 [Tilletia laevis]CAD6883915.1 unnamed protein product [Tilletia caries]